MIVFLNIEQNEILIYSDSGLKKISFKEFSKIKSHLKEQDNILYVTNVIKTDAKQICNTIKEITQQKNIALIEVEENLYIHCKENASIYIQDIDFTFRGQDDFIDIKILKKKFGKEILTEGLISNLMGSKKLEILTFSEMLEYKSESNIRKEKAEKEDHMIVGDGAVGGALDYVETGAMGQDDIVTIDLNDDIRKIGSGGGGGGNEGSLLPSDF